MLSFNIITTKDIQFYCSHTLRMVRNQHICCIIHNRITPKMNVAVSDSCLQGLRFLQQCCWWCMSCVMWQCFIQWVVCYISESWKLLALGHKDTSKKTCIFKFFGYPIQ